MLKSTEHGISTAHKNGYAEQIKFVIAFKLSDPIYIMLHVINVKMPTIAGILTFTSMLKFTLSSVEHEKKL